MNISEKLSGKLQKGEEEKEREAKAQKGRRMVFFHSSRGGR